MIISAIWLASAAFFLVVALKSTQLARSVRTVVDLPNGTIDYVAGEGVEDLSSKKTGLIGRPDYVINVKGSFVPVEIKTGRVPRGPLFSHIMQLTAYCVLVEEKYGKTEYGMLMYGNQAYRISLTGELKTTLFKKVDKMREALKTGVVHRDHSRPGKCRHCSRRNACAESLV
jgi:CRISPR-associated exonuclease Cas4